MNINIPAYNGFPVDKEVELTTDAQKLTIIYTLQVNYYTYILSIIIQSANEP
jgi:hypothetical protein